MTTEVREQFEVFVLSLGYQPSTLQRREGGDYALPLVNDLERAYLAGSASRFVEVHDLTMALRNIDMWMSRPRWATLPPEFTRQVQRWIEGAGIKRSILR